MNKILIAPYAARMFDGRPSPKDYPYFPKLVALLNENGYEVIQIGVTGEVRIEGTSQFITNWPLGKIPSLVDDCATWISSDSMLSHLCHYHRLKPGIVLFGPSDDRVWGYPQNINLLRGRDYLRPLQFQNWNDVRENPTSFVYAENVIPHVHKLAPIPLAYATRSQSLEPADRVRLVPRGLPVASES